MRHAGTRLCAQQLATSPTTFCEICGIPLLNFQIFAVVRIPPIGATSAAVRRAPRLLRDSNPYERDYLLTQHLLLFVTATFLLGIYFLPVPVI